MLILGFEHPPKALEMIYNFDFVNNSNDNKYIAIARQRLCSCSYLCVAVDCTQSMRYDSMLRMNPSKISNYTFFVVVVFSVAHVNTLGLLCDSGCDQVSAEGAKVSRASVCHRLNPFKKKEKKHQIFLALVHLFAFLYSFAPVHPQSLQHKR